MSIPKPVILDISEHQVPSGINYDNLAKSIDGAIVRIQFGSRYIDKHYKTHISELQKRGIPVAVYAWIRGINKADVAQEAKALYHRATAYNPVMWWLDVEERSMGDMRGGTEAYRNKLKSLGAKKVGVYVANHLYSQFNLDMSKFDGIWIPTYGSNSGQYNGSNPTATSNYNLHQYTSNGRLPGYNGPLDLSRIAKGKFSDFFGTTTASNPSTPTGGKIKMKTLKLNTAVKLRRSASTSAGVIATLPAGTKIKFDDVVIAGGYIWAVQPRTDNFEKGYIAIGKIDAYGSVC